MLSQTEVLLDQKYRILKKIGSGGSAQVYLARDVRLHKMWAIKKIRKESTEETIVKQGRSHDPALRESLILKGLYHPAIPRIVDVFEENGCRYIVMDYIHGLSADRTVKEYGPIPEKKAVSWAIKICEALVYLHTRKPPVIYRDLKPSNIMITSEEQIKLIDFGISFEGRDGEQGKEIYGTKGYAPPEQYEGVADIRSDIYSFGMTLYFLLTGEEPKEDGSEMSFQTSKQIISEEIQAVIRKCTQRIYTDRYQSSEELLKDLLQSDKTTQNHRINKRKHFNIRRIRIGAGILSVCACIGFGLFIRQKNRETDAGIKKEYALKMDVSTAASYEERIKGCVDAIEAAPERTDAYKRLLEIYEEMGDFGPTNSRLFVSLYETNKGAFDTADKEVAELNYKAGILFLGLYQEEGNPDNRFMSGIQKAYSFFKKCHIYNENCSEEERMSAAEFYYQICEFYKRYVFAVSDPMEPSSQECETLFQELNRMAADIEKERKNGSQISSYKVIPLIKHKDKDGVINQQFLVGRYL